jgi:hypothetical protein
MSFASRSCWPAAPALPPQLLWMLFLTANLVLIFLLLLPWEGDLVVAALLIGPLAFYVVLTCTLQKFEDVHRSLRYKPPSLNI